MGGTSRSDVAKSALFGRHTGTIDPSFQGSRDPKKKISHKWRIFSNFPAPASRYASHASASLNPKILVQLHRDEGKSFVVSSFSSNTLLNIVIIIIVMFVIPRVFHS